MKIEMIDGRSTIHACNCEDATPCMNGCTCNKNKVSTVAPLNKSYRTCRWYHPVKGAAPEKACILRDLCEMRNITDCPVRLSYSQGIEESDEQFDEFLQSVGSSALENLNTFMASRGRV